MNGSRKESVGGEMRLNEKSMSLRDLRPVRLLGKHQVGHSDRLNKAINVILPSVQRKHSTFCMTPKKRGQDGMHLRSSVSPTCCNHSSEFWDIKLEG